MLRNLRVRGTKSKESLNSVVLTSRSVADEMKFEESGVVESAGEVSGEVFNCVEQAPAFVT